MTEPDETTKREKTTGWCVLLGAVSITAGLTLRVGVWAGLVSLGVCLLILAFTAALSD